MNRIIFLLLLMIGLSHSLLFILPTTQNNTLYVKISSTNTSYTCIYFSQPFSKYIALTIQNKTEINLTSKEMLFFGITKIRVLEYCGSKNEIEYDVYIPISINNTIKNDTINETSSGITLDYVGGHKTKENTSLFYVAFGFVLAMFIFILLYKKIISRF